jgi:hypothetical protein
MTGSLEPDVTPPSRRRRWVAPLVAAAGAVVAVGIGVGIGLAAADRDDDPASSSATAQLDDIREACSRWMDGQATDRPGAGWCADMTGWMGRRMADGSMTGPMMWGDAEQMRATCQAWVQAAPPAGATAGWCDEMLHGMWPDIAGGRNGGMGGPMMGG